MSGIQPINTCVPTNTVLTQIHPETVAAYHRLELLTCDEIRKICNHWLNIGIGDDYVAALSVEENAVDYKMMEMFGRALIEVGSPTNKLSINDAIIMVLDWHCHTTSQSNTPNKNLLPNIDEYIFPKHEETPTKLIRPYERMLTVVSIRYLELIIDGTLWSNAVYDLNYEIDARYRRLYPDRKRLYVGETSGLGHVIGAWYVLGDNLDGSTFRNYVHLPPAERDRMLREEKQELENNIIEQAKHDLSHLRKKLATFSL